MDDSLDAYHYLLTLGWEWEQNCLNIEADEILIGLRFKPDALEYRVGMPKQGAKYTSEQLKLRGMVGIYKRGGRPVRSFSPDDSPSSPVFLEPPSKPKEPTPLKVGGMRDKPLRPFVASGVCPQRAPLTFR
jgi:hypothetical protein